MNYEENDDLGIYKKPNTGPGPELMGADTLIGNDVVNKMEENLGEIKEIMLRMGNGEVAYAVLSFGGFLGVGNKLFAVPWQALTLDTTYKRFILDISKERLEAAPGFDKDDWPNMEDPIWKEEISSFYGNNQGEKTDTQRRGMN